MEGQNLQNGGEPSEFEMIADGYGAKPGATGDDAGATVSKSGLVKLNVRGKAETQDVADRSKVDLEHLAFRYGVNINAGTVAAYAVKVESDQQVALVRKGQQYSFHLGAVFEKYPKLRPFSRRIQCPVVSRTDQKGVPYLLIALGAGMPKITVKRGSGSSDNNAAGKQGTK
jgi:hypothetical protein